MEELVFLDGDVPEPADDGDGDEPKMGACSECGESLDGLPIMSIVQHIDGNHRHLRCDLPGFKGGESAGPAPLPPVAADAPDVYDPRSRAARQTLARRLDAELRALGFVPARATATEVVYERLDGDITCKVYSTIVGGEVRGLGKDAIRVALVQDGRGVGKARRVNRVGKIADIMGRVAGRIRSLTRVGRRGISGPREG